MDYKYKFLRMQVQNCVQNIDSRFVITYDETTCLYIVDRNEIVIFNNAKYYTCSCLMTISSISHY